MPDSSGNVACITYVLCRTGSCGELRASSRLGKIPNIVVQSIDLSVVIQTQTSAFRRGSLGGLRFQDTHPPTTRPRTWHQPFATKLVSYVRTTRNTPPLPLFYHHRRRFHEPPRLPPHGGDIYRAVGYRRRHENAGDRSPAATSPRPPWFWPPSYDPQHGW